MLFILTQLTRTRRSRTGFLVFVYNALIYWHSTRQTSVETSQFGSEFMAIKYGTGCVHGLRYKLRMMGINIDVHGDNQFLLAKMAAPGYKLNKSNTTVYHHVQKGVVRDEWRTTYINTPS